MEFVAFAPALVDYVYLIDEYPERGGHTIVRGFTKSAGGAGCNVAHNLASVGVDAKIYTTLGSDDDAEFFLSETAAKVVYEVTDDRTGRVHVFVDSGGERTFFVEPNAAAKPYVDVGESEYLYLDPFPTEVSFNVQLSIARGSEAFVILNPGYPYIRLGFEKLSEMLGNVDMVILSRDEFNALSVSVEDILKFVDYLIITEGGRGSRCFTADGEFFAEAYPAKPVDTTGAGDAFAAGFIYAFMRSVPIDVCLKLGNFCGAYNVERVGARNFPDKSTIEAFLARVLKNSDDTEA